MTARDSELRDDGPAADPPPPSTPGPRGFEAASPSVRPPRLHPIPMLQVLRGGAAFAVVLTHAASSAYESGFAPEPFNLAFGNFGVDVFFVISGFIIVYASTPLYTHPRAWLTFITKRLIRIVPLYWIVLSLYLFFRYATGSASNLTSLYISMSYLFVPYAAPEDGAYFPFYFPGWTLEFEMFFYACFAAVLFMRRTSAVIAVSAVMTAVLALGKAGLLSPTLSFWYSSQLVEFVVGCLVAEAYLRGSRLPGWSRVPLVAVSILWVLVTSLEYGGSPGLRGITWGLPATALVMAAAMAARPRRPDRPSGPIRMLRSGLIGLGDASYALYVVHLLVIHATIHVIQGSFRNWHLLPVAAYMLLMPSLAVAAAFLCFHLIERPLARRLRRLATRP